MTEQVPDDATTTQPSGTAAGEILSQLIHDVGHTIRREVEQVRDAAAERAAGGAGAGAAVLARRGLSELGAAAPIDTDSVKDAARQAVRSLG